MRAATRSAPSRAPSYAALVRFLVNTATTGEFKALRRSLSGAVPLPSEIDLLARLQRDDPRRRRPHCLDQLLRRALDHRIGAVVHRDRVFRLDELPERMGRVHRVHGEMPADG